VKQRWIGTIGAVGIVPILALAGCGGGEEESGPRVVEVSMTDFAFAPTTLEVDQGDVVVFRFTNDGTVSHEAVIGDEMFQMGHMDHQHLPGDTMPGSVLVAPGETAELPYVFSVPGTVLIGCHVDDHWDLGMRATIEVAPG
jgi:uncharacterized cupredoxin-like copper-binding protein